MEKSGGSDKDLDARILKVQITFKNLTKVWSSRVISKKKMELKIYNSNVKSMLFYAIESWKVNKKMEAKLRTFHNKCLRQILCIFWHYNISNPELLNRLSGESDLFKQTKERKCDILECF